MQDCGFSTAEFEERTQRVQAMMRAKRLDAILLTTEPNVRYFTGFYTQFWESPTRPWFLVIPADAKPIAVIPTIGESGMRDTWIETIHTWSSPNPKDDGISLLSSVIASLPKKHGRIGATLGLQSYLRMPHNDFMQLQKSLPHQFVDIAYEIHQLRSVKSSAEIEKLRKACAIAGAGFARIPEHAKVGQSEKEICTQMRIDMLNAGADFVRYLISGSGPDGYGSIIMGPSARIMQEGDVLIIDAGAVYDGYFSDFDRNYAFGHCSDLTKRAYDCVYAATEAGLATARPGVTTTDVYNAMQKVMEEGGALGNCVGRLGHGLGIQLTEWPSNTATDNTPLEEGMVITLEPGMVYAEGKEMVHEENIVITADGCELLSPRAAEHITIIR